jgi:ribosomal protein L32
MPPHPKRKHSKGRRDRRRAHDSLETAIWWLVEIVEQ